MKDRLLLFLKTNKKKMITFIVTGILAAVGVVADTTALTELLSVMIP